MKKKPLAIVGCDTSKKIIEKLIVFGFEVCILPQDERLPRPIRSHADMLMFATDEYIFCDNEYFKKAHVTFDRIQEYGYKIIKCSTELSDVYPHDIPFNVATVGNHLFGKLDFVAREIINHAKERGRVLVNVKQGYTKCSTVILGNKSIITADKSIHIAAMTYGIDVFKIENSSDISLNGYNYGFIGGACGVYENKVFFIGSITLHPNYIQIVDFCLRNGFEVISLSDVPLVDIGGIIFLDSLI